ncbi:MAG: polysaccharide biosynthesis/export family protein [Terracidiphilus sp.]
MKCSAKHPFQTGLFLIVCSGSLLAQVPNAGNADNGPQKTVDAPSQTQPSTSSAKPHDNSYVIGNDDVVAISVWKEPELSKSIPVRSDGKISLPLVGEVQATGRTPVQLEQDLSEKLRNFVTTPEVTVIVEQINSKKFNIMGEVGRPGSYSIALASTVMDAIAAAGGFRDFAKKKDVYILRQNADGSESRIAFNYKDFIKGKNPAQNVKLEPRDTIIVP